MGPVVLLYVDRGASAVESPAALMTSLYLLALGSPTVHLGFGATLLAARASGGHAITYAGHCPLAHTLAVPYLSDNSVPRLVPS